MRNKRKTKGTGSRPADRAEPVRSDNLFRNCRSIFRLPSLLLRAFAIKSTANVMDDVAVWNLSVFSLLVCGMRGLIIAPVLVAATYVPPSLIRPPELLKKLLRKGIGNGKLK